MAKGFGKLQNGLFLDSIFKTLPNVYISLNEGDPGIDGQSGTEASGGGYARIVTTPSDWDTATDAMPTVTQNATILQFPQATTDWNTGATFTHFGFWRTMAGTTENDYIGRAELTTPKQVLTDDILEFGIGDIDVTLDETV